MPKDFLRISPAQQALWGPMWTVVTELVDGREEPYETTETDRIAVLTMICVIRNVPFAWYPRRSLNDVMVWQLRLVSHAGLGFTSYWSLVPSSAAYMMEGGKHGW